MTEIESESKLESGPESNSSSELHNQSYNLHPCQNIRTIIIIANNIRNRGRISELDSELKSNYLNRNQNPNQSI